jgi:ParB family transcriptional regulator, chromosome partitioning protein
MRLEFHQLDRRWEHLRVRPPARQRQLLASLAEVGQQTPIVVVAVEGQPGRYLVIDGYKRLAALEQLGRDTVEAVVWPMSAAEALMLDRSLRFSPHETALEQGWLLAELEQRYGYGQEELARRFDRSLSWVSRRLALVDLLPEGIQQQVREGQLSTHVAMKFLVPVARVSLDACQRMAAVFVQHHCNTRQAGQLYAAWRDGLPLTRQRLLDQPELFFKTQPPAEPPASTTGAAGLRRDLDVASALLQRAQRRLAGAGAAEMDHPQRQAVRRQIEHLRQQLNRLAERIPEEEEETYVESIPTDRNSRTEPTGSEQTRDRAGAGHLPSVGPQSSAFPFSPSAGTASSRESRTLPATDSGTVRPLQGESGASP